jgi:NAD(P)-dependent dehydrogenase (short-subunit alcohol dehydrogenase family)
METSMDKVLLVTGVSSGLGRAIAVEALAAGYRVAGTVRNPKAAEGFESLSPERAEALILDVTDELAITAGVAQAERALGPIHALVNNAGYGHEGTLEESPMCELRNQFEVNVFGAVAMMKAVLPGMRARRSGRIVNITSMGGLMTMPGIAFYHGSKYALEGISGSLAKEVKSFGIFVTAVEPGMFRTDWAGRSMVRSNRHLADYDAIFEPIREARLSRDGKQPGDPAKAGRAILKLLESPTPPSHLMLGPDALEYVAAARRDFDVETAQWEDLSRSTNFS